MTDQTTVSGAELEAAADGMIHARRQMLENWAGIEAGYQDRLRRQAKRIEELLGARREALDLISELVEGTDSSRAVARRIQAIKEA